MTMTSSTWVLVPVMSTPSRHQRVLAANDSIVNCAVYASVHEKVDSRRVDHDKVVHDKVLGFDKAGQRCVPCTPLETF